jgi:hypothetical protein
MRTILLAAILGAGTAHAAPTTWQFSYTGFLETIDARDRDGTTHSERFLPDYTIRGSFTGADANGDGTIALTELTAFEVAGWDYFPCMAAPSPYSSCTISRFSYAADGTLDFSAGWGGHDEYDLSWYGGVTSGVREVYATDRYLTGYMSTHSWTDATAFSITSSVPEPATGAMAALGALLLLARGRFRRR